MPPVCTTNAECGGPTGVCDVAGNACVTCLPDQVDACSGQTPACGANHTCVACRSNLDCPLTGVCLEGGACAADSSLIAYIAPNGSGSLCTKDAPCNTHTGWNSDLAEAKDGWHTPAALGVRAMATSHLELGGEVGFTSILGTQNNPKQRVAFVTIGWR